MATASGGVAGGGAMSSGGTSSAAGGVASGGLMSGGGTSSHTEPATGSHVLPRWAAAGKACLRPRDNRGFASRPFVAPRSNTSSILPRRASGRSQLRNFTRSGKSFSALEGAYSGSRRAHTTVMLSRPPWALAAVIRCSHSLSRSFSLVAISASSGSGTMPERPSVHSRYKSPRRG